MDLFTKNGISHPELRLQLGREPMTAEEEKQLFFHKFAIPLALIGAVDENSGLGKPIAPTAGGGSVSNKSNPQNQHGGRGTAKLNRDSFLNASRTDVNPIAFWHDSFRDELQERWARSDGYLDPYLTRSDADLNYQVAHEAFMDELKRIARSYCDSPEVAAALIKQAEASSLKYVRKLRNDVLKRVLDKN